MKNLAVILLSGGMDSAFCLAKAIEMGFEPAALHLNYKQRTEERELKAYTDLCDYYNISKRLVVDINYLSQIGGSSLTDKNIEVAAANLDSKEAPSSYVPFRNANILAIAVSWAEVIGAKAIFIGAVEEDSSGYPDTRKVFFDAFEKVIETGTKEGSGIKIYTPVLNIGKDEIVKEGFALGLPFHYTWSCYKSSDKACGECDSCGLRLRAFKKAGYEDPIEYHKKPQY
jgi:7-cyano-7-deazaguanine synthase